MANILSSFWCCLVMSLDKMSARRRTSARLKNKEGGIPLPPEHNDIYGENDEIVPVLSGRLRRRGEEDDDELVLAQHDMLRHGASPVALRNSLSGNAPGGNNAAGNGAGGATGAGLGTGSGTGSGTGPGTGSGAGANPAPSAPGNAPNELTGAAGRNNPGLGYDNGLGGREIDRWLDSPREFLPVDIPPSYFDPNNPPFPENGGHVEPPGESRTDLPNPYRTPYNSGLHPPESSTLAAKYGMAGGRIPTMPLSARSFIHENDLYENADVRTPVPHPMSQRPVQQPRLIPFPPMRPREKPSNPNLPSQPQPQPPGLQAPSQPDKGQRPTQPVPEGVDLPPSRPLGPISSPSLPEGSGGRRPQPPPSGPNVDTGKRPWFNADLLSGLRNRLAFTRGQNINAPQEPRPWTTKDDLTPNQLAMAEKLRQDMRRPDVGDGNVQKAAMWQKLTSPAHPPSGTEGGQRPNPTAPEDRARPPKEPRPITGGPKGSNGSAPGPGNRDPRPPSGTGSRPENRDPRPSNGSAPGPVVTGGRSPPRPPPRDRPLETPDDPSWWGAVQRWLDIVWAGVCDVFTSFWHYRLLLLLIPLLYFAYTNLQMHLGLPRVSRFDLSGLGKYIPSPVPFQLKYGPQLDQIRDRLERLEDDVRGLLIREGSKSVGGGGPVSVIAVDKDKNGRLIVPPAFYEALKDRISRDQKLIKEVVDQGLPAIDDHLLASDTLSKAWDSWVIHNKKKVVQTLGPEMEKEVAKMTQKEVNSYLKKNGDKFGADKSLVSPDDFGKLVQKEIKTGLAKELKETANQVSELDQKLQKYIDNPPQGMSRAQVTALVERVVNKYKNNLNSGAAADAGLKGHFANYEANNINFFSVGSGALVDPTLSSPKWKIPKYKLESKKWYDRDGYKPQPLFTAITSWAEEGECFCAGPNIRGEGVGTANVSVLISRDVVPRYLVVEHILPGATLDAAATPKDIEVWGSFTDINLRKTVLGWSESRFPDAVPERALHSGFVKLGEFEYQSVSSGDGVQVFTLSNELLDMNAAANHFVVRAMNNQGGADHTCFYRLRLYGDVRERDLGF
jgi:hypothetical protein